MFQKNFQYIQLLGKGSFAQVHKVKRIQDNLIYALKKVKLANLKPKQIQSAINQVRLLASIIHPNIIGFKQTFVDQKNQLNLVLQYACTFFLSAKGDLQTKIKNLKKNKKRFTEFQIWKALNHIAEGLKVLHQNKIMHRDLKSSNIFISQSQKGNIYKIGDMNVSTVLKRDLARTQTGTPYYCSPQVWNQRPYNYKSDIYSLGMFFLRGCIIYEMSSHYPPFMAEDLQSLYIKVQRNKYKRIPNKYSQELFLIIQQMISFNPKSRPSAFSLLEREHIKKIQEFNKKKYLFTARQKSYSSLLDTIKIPINIKDINKNLPRPRYGQDMIANGYSVCKTRIFPEIKNQSLEKSRGFSTKALGQNNLIVYKNLFPSIPNKFKPPLIR